MRGERLKMCIVRMSLVVFIGYLVFMNGSITYATEGDLSINNENVQVGEAIKVTKSNSVTSLKWYVDGTEIETGDEFIPSQSDMEKWISVKGFDSQGNEIAQDKLYFSNIPVIYINTDDGRAILDKTDRNASMFIQGNDRYDAKYDGKITIRVRGNSSAAFPQKPYKIKLNKKSDLFGMGENKHWVLISNYLDQCAMRNKLGSVISKEFGLENMEMIWVDVVINDEYSGLYMLSENIRIDKTRVDIFDWENLAKSVAKGIKKADKLSDEDQDAIEELLCADFEWVSTGEFIYNDKKYELDDYEEILDITGGYLFESSEEYDEVSKFMTDNGLKIMLKKPEELRSNEDMMTFSANFWQSYENALTSDSGCNNKGKHYSDYADFDSMVKYWLTMETLGNNDAVYKSRYAYLDKAEKLIFGPVWDFDWGCGSYTVGKNSSGWKLSTGTLWKDFVDDPFFQVKAAELYWNKRDYLDELISDSGLFDISVNMIREAGNANDLKYPEDVFVEKYKRRNFETDAEIFKTYFSNRLGWLDSTFSTNETLSSSFSGIKSSRGDSYLKQEDKLAFNVIGGVEDVVSEHLPADCILGNKVKTELLIDSSKAAAEKYEIYINSKYVGNAVANEEGYSFAISPDMLTEPMGKRNVIAVIGRDADGKLVCTNYKTVIQSSDISNSTYTITYDSKGGTEIAAKAYQYGANIEEPDDPVKEGSVFIGWYTDENCTSLFKFGKMPARNITLYAGWHDVDESSHVYALNFVSNGGTVIPTIITEDPSEIARPEDPDREGYTFAGWYADKDFQNEFLFDAINEGSNTTYARWDVNSYSLKFDSCGGSAVEDVITGEYGSEISAPESPEREGYVFAGWYKDNTYLVRFPFGFMPAGDYTLYAKWTPKEYMMRFVSNGGNYVPYIMAGYETEISAPSAPEKEGYTFAGWYSDRALATEYMFDTMPLGTTILYAKWDINSYSVTFDSNGGSDIEGYTDVVYGTELAVPAEPTREGYVFTGWYEDSSCESVFTFGKMPGRDLTLYAGWTANQYVIRFVTNGGSTVDALTADYEMAVEAPEDPVREGYTFAGWYSDEFLTEAYAFSTMPLGGITVYAGWNVNTYVISFYTNGGNEITDIVAQYGSEVVAPEEDPQKEGHTFIGWYSDAECQIPYEFGTMPAGDVTLYAGWEVNEYTATFDSCGGNEVAPVMIAYGSAITVPETPEREGYTFTGWFTDKECTAAFAAGEELMPARDIVVYAGWTINKYGVAFDSCGGSDVEPIEVVFGEEIPVPTEPTKEGHVFKGWYVDAECTELFAFGPMSAGELTLYAGWEINGYIVTFDTRGGSEIEPVNVAYGEQIPTPAEPTKEGHVFKGWYANAECTEVFSFGTMPAKDLTLYAGWSRDESSPTDTPEDNPGGDSPGTDPGQGGNSGSEGNTSGENGSGNSQGGSSGAGDGGTITGDTSEQHDSGTNAGGTVVPVESGSNTGDKAAQSALVVGQVVPAVNKYVSCKITFVGQNGELPEAAFIYSKDSDKKSVTIPGSVKLQDGTVVKITSIDDNAFKKNKTITKVVIGKNVKKIGKKAFYGCKNLKTIVVKTTKLTKNRVGKKAFSGVSKEVVVKAPKSKVEKYGKIFAERGLPKSGTVVER
ncbi:InlB B-repeat-containing protein [Butyrivibrio sp. VCD2006]|uniref:InlB B-repeat-containing protein n=1 Tax=Butyrivibrio sp. VCD2006 TaxID=1280664 RepID=UPI0004022E95|nr:InlB B-repeat-containing protein [Butyrivibrio sp. VCD2006]